MSNAEENDEALVRRAGAGDRAAAAMLIERHTNRVYAVCYRMLKNSAAAEDASQETFLRLWKHADRWKPQGAKFETWLTRVAMNLCLDQLRKRGRELPEEEGPEMPDPAAGPDDALFSNERARAIEQAIHMLPDRQRIAVTLCHLQELSNIEAADIMNISVDAMESLLARARRNLRDRLAPMQHHLTGTMSHDAISNIS